MPASLLGPDKFLESSWVDGSKVSITGIFVGKVDEHQTTRQEGVSRLEGFQIVMRSPRDVVLISRPSWWNTEHTVQVLGLTGLLMIAILSWVAVLRRQVHRQTEIIRQSEERFRHLAEHDGLTGLPVRTVLLERLDIALREIKRRCSSLALLMIDVDNFKHLNDTMGHAAGDQVLCAIGSRLQAAVRPSDTVARLGGDEFTVLLAGLHHPDEARKIAAALVAKATEPILIDGRHLEVSISVGIATYPESGMDVKALLSNSDAALYRAKARGRNCYQIHSEAEASQLVLG
jgi:diguanylate cyclase (GGDEF)-like protein